MSERAGSYLLAGQPTELERLQLQSRVWEAAGRALLAQLPVGSGLRVLDVGFGALGWLRILSEWIGPDGSVVGSEVDDRMLTIARAFIEAETLANVTLERMEQSARGSAPTPRRQRPTCPSPSSGYRRWTDRSSPHTGR